MVEGEPWFVAKDVCAILEVRNTSDALSRLDAEDKGIGLTDTLGGKQSVTVVNESGLYSLILGSRKPEARAFKRWVISSAPRLRVIIGEKGTHYLRILIKMRYHPSTRQ